MANPEHLAILKSGVPNWNQWRLANPGTVPDLAGADLEGGFLVGADLRNANLRRSVLYRVDCRMALFAYADLYFSEVSRAKLNGVQAFKADLSRTDLFESDLQEVDFTDASLNGADLSGTNLSRTILSGASLTGSTLRLTVLAGTNFSQSRFSGTIIADCDLRGACALESVAHYGPSTIGIDTIYRSGGNIPETFLRRAGVPEIFIKYARSLVGRPIEFYSCFISYSSKDQEFADRLYGELQKAGIRCWFAPHDIEGGDLPPENSTSDN